jgi:acyl carrier protein
MCFNKMNLKEDVRKFLESQIQIPISDKICIFDDTGIDGIDAYDLMVAFSERYTIDMSAFNYEQFFTSEKDLLNFPKALYRRWIKGIRLKSFDLSHLVKVVERKEWFDPE